MPHKEEYPGASAARAYVRKIMADGRWRNSNDIVRQAEKDGMLLNANAAGFHMGKLAVDGFLVADDTHGGMMWRAAK